MLLIYNIQCPLMFYSFLLFRMASLKNVLHSKLSNGVCINALPLLVSIITIPLGVAGLGPAQPASHPLISAHRGRRISVTSRPQDGCCCSGRETAPADPEDQEDPEEDPEDQEQR